MFVGFFIGVVSGTFVGMSIMSICKISSRDSRYEEKRIK